MEIVAPELADLQQATADKDLISLYRYWNDKRRSRLCPSRKDIDPVEFSFALSRTSLVEVLGEPRRFFYRLVSTTLTERLGYEMTRRFVTDIPEPDVRNYVFGLYTRAVELRVPVYEKSKRIYDDRRWDHEALLLPLSSDGANVDMLIVYRTTHHPERLPRWARIEQQLQEV